MIIRPAATLSGRKKMIVLVVLMVLLPWALLLFICDPATDELEIMDARIASLQMELETLRMLKNQCQVDVKVMAHHLSRLVTGPRPWENRTLPSWSLMSSESQMLVHRLNEGRHLPPESSNDAVAVNMPSVFTFLPHLLEDPGSLRPVYKVGKCKEAKDVTLVLGMATVRREEQTYLVATLHDLFHAMAPDEEEISLVIVLIAETDILFVMQVVKEIRAKFEYQLEAGLLEVISPPASYYPDFTKMTPTLGDSPERFQWRTKQALDYAFLMAYAQGKGSFYLQLEDDLMSRPGFVTNILDAVSQKNLKKEPWLIMDFCALGFIGKMIHSTDLPRLVQFLIMFHADKPSDWILDSMVHSLACGPSMNETTCVAAKRVLWYQHGLSLFQHVGIFSSLQGKFQPLRIRKQWEHVEGGKWAPQPPGDDSHN